MHVELPAHFVNLQDLCRRFVSNVAGCCSEQPWKASVALGPNFATWATRFSIVDWVCSKTHILLATLRTQNQLREGILCMFGSRTLVPISWMCKKQTSVSHSSTASEIISLDAGLRMDGLLALDLWDVVIEVLRSTNNTTTPINPPTGNSCETGDCSRNTSKLAQKVNREVDQLLHVDYVPMNTHPLQGESQLYMFEDNDAVIKMIIKGRSPTMRHVSRTNAPGAITPPVIVHLVRNRCYSPWS